MWSQRETETKFVWLRKKSNNLDEVCHDMGMSQRISLPMTVVCSFKFKKRSQGNDLSPQEV